MTIAIGGWMLLLVTGGAANVPNVAATGIIVRGYDTASDCEKDRASHGWSATHRCLPALSLVSR